jgi:molecular chaperone DnaK (HSP70)
MTRKPTNDALESGETARDVIGVDFGTTNTYVTICPYGAMNKSPLHLTGRTPAIDTAILYSDVPEADPSVFPVIGENATVTYGQATQEEILREKYRYHANFKLDVANSETARRCAIDFLKALRRDAQLNGTPLEPERSRIIFGAPCEADPGYREALKEVARESGLGRIEILDEPLGALLTDLGGGRFPLSDAMAGYLAVDFGGGTCDFALIRRGEVVKSWGELELGGRLFDDLFYQWFMEQNPGLEEELRRTGRDFYVWSYCCRRLKEDFSETASKNLKVDMKAEVGRFGSITGLTREEFLARASD